MKKSFIIALMTISLLCGVLSAGLVSASDTGAADGLSISLSDDFTAIRTGESVGEVSNLVFDGNAEYGAVPGSAWGATVSGGDGSILYTLTANEGEVLTGGNVSFTAGGGHAGGVYWHNASNQLGANLKVSVSTDGNTWTEVFDFDKTAGYVKTNDQASAASGRYSNTDSPLSLDAYIANSHVAYIRFDVEHFTAAETGIAGWDQTGIPLGKVGLCLYNIAIHADQGELAGIELENDWTQGGSVGTFEGVIDWGGVVKDEAAGNKDYAHSRQGLGRRSGYLLRISHLRDLRRSRFTDERSCFAAPVRLF